MDLSVTSATIGRQVGGRTLPESRLEIIGGGNVEVRAGRDLSGGVFYTGRGETSLYAGDAIGRSELTNLAPVLALGDSQAYLSSRADLEVSAVVNPTLVGRGTSQTATNSYFSTYTPRSGVSLTSASGDVTLRNASSSELRTQFTSIVLVAGEQAVASLYPPDVLVSSLRGNIVVANSLSLFPASRGGLHLLAEEDVRIESEGGVQITVSDGDPAYLPSLASPRINTDRVEQVFFSARQPHPNNPEAFHAVVPERLRLGRTDFEPSRIVANQGDMHGHGYLPWSVLRGARAHLGGQGRARPDDVRAEPASA